MLLQYSVCNKTFTFIRYLILYPYNITKHLLFPSTGVYVDVICCSSFRSSVFTQNGQVIKSRLIHQDT